MLNPINALVDAGASLDGVGAGTFICGKGKVWDEEGLEPGREFGGETRGEPKGVSALARRGANFGPGRSPLIARASSWEEILIGNPSPKPIAPLGATFLWSFFLSSSSSILAHLTARSLRIKLVSLDRATTKLDLTALTV